jgi:hypothetical protein
MLGNISKLLRYGKVNAYKQLHAIKFPEGVTSNVKRKSLESLR